MKFGTILADPPWPYKSPKAIVGNAGRGSQNGKAAEIIQVNVQQHYNTMSIEQLSQLEVAEYVDENAHLYLWTTNSFMVEAHKIAEAWGFKPKTILTWVKVKKENPNKPSMKTGHWYRSATEHIVFAVKGKIRLSGKTMPTAFMLPRLPHSVKPDYFYELIESESPGPYLELFARKRRENWDCWGNQIESTIQL
jgi:N6-adenosine-specific RNA methylase IME4